MFLFFSQGFRDEFAICQIEKLEYFLRKKLESSESSNPDLIESSLLHKPQLIATSWHSGF